MSYEPMSPVSTRRLTGRNTNRYSVTALFSMAAEQDVEVEDDLAKGAFSECLFLCSLSLRDSPEATARSQSQNLDTVQKEFCVGARCPVSGLSNCAVDSKQDGSR